MSVLSRMRPQMQCAFCYSASLQGIPGRNLAYVALTSKKKKVIGANWNVEFYSPNPNGPIFFKIHPFSPWLGGSVGWSLIPYTKSFDSQSGNISRLQVWYPFRSCIRGIQSMFLSQHWCFFLCLSLSLSACHPLLLSLSKISKNICSGKNIKN